MAAKMNIPLSFKANIHHWLVIFFMVLSTAAAWWLTPHIKWFDHLGSPEFANVVPNKFGDWEQIPDAAGSLIVDPQQQDALNNLYTQIVGRSYVHKPSGRLIMLSLAYGDNQTYSKQLHRPESCYSSQGFKIQNLREEEMKAAGLPMSIRRMTAVFGSRLEQVSYFIRIGDKVISGPPSALNLARMSMGLKGYISDGLLFRVSEVGDDEKLSNQLHDQFINDLLKALSPVQRIMLVGQR
jgi:EpsI family protein